MANPLQELYDGLSYLGEFIEELRFQGVNWRDITPEERIDLLTQEAADLKSDMDRTERAVIAAAYNPVDVESMAAFQAARMMLQQTRGHYWTINRTIRTFKERVKMIDKDLTKEEAYDWNRLSPLEDRYHQYLEVAERLGLEILTFDQWLTEEGLA